ncbi:MAG: UDP-glucose--hexose-1-phosphate uridylyltransferase [Clostridia bacterium]|nr:UDP-glucose--hexose-1-phosphate uridylyltransferase [Clostridia bacterium]
MICESIAKLVKYGLDCGLIEQEDKIYTVNRILEILGIDEYEAPVSCEWESLESILKDILDYACKNGLIENTQLNRDLFDTKIMSALVPRPSEVISHFDALYAVSPEMATDYYYKLSKDTDYIRRYRVCKDLKWKTESEYGEIDITVNLSKPEKDPKDIAIAATLKQSSYPKCLLCMENEGYAGRLNHPARQNHRIIPVEINGKQWGFQYSPYVYYNEHCIVFNGEHKPMKIDESAFIKLFDFVKLFPHYFIGSNADLPVVGGSILSHEHFQGGNYEFAMAKAETEKTFTFKGYENLTVGTVKWPMSVIRISGEDTSEIVSLASKILDAWRGYTDEDAFIFAETNGTPHNTITPIARKKGDRYELDLVLRNNIKTPEHPDGVYHPHQELHNIKKENIGLIEVMGLAVLPSRLKNELAKVEEFILAGKDLSSDKEISKHAEWVSSFKDNYDFTAENIDTIVKKEVGKVFVKCLEHAGVYKRDEKGQAAFERFISFAANK